MSADQLAIIVAGLVWPVIYQLLKDKPGLVDRWAHLAAFVCSYLVALVVDLALQTGPLTWQVVFLHGSEIAGIAEAVYSQVIKPYFPGGAPPLPAPPSSGPKTG